MMRGASYEPLKRLIDVVVSLGLLLVTAPLQGFVAVLVRINLGAPVLFRQPRPGRHEKPFELLKFRTMHTLDESKGMISDEQRLTALGAVLRSTSLDELPTLLNVLKGEMSLVGPRPLLLEYLRYYSPREAARHQVRPGVTGLAQVRGRNKLSWKEKLELDLEYVEQRSLQMDLKIMAWTVWRVCTRDGITPDGRVSMPEFRGNERDVQD